MVFISKLDLTADSKSSESLVETVRSSISVILSWISWVLASRVRFRSSMGEDFRLVVNYFL